MKGKMRNLLSVLLVAGVAAGMLAGCSNHVVGFQSWEGSSETVDSAKTDGKGHCRNGSAD